MSVLVLTLGLYMLGLLLAAVGSRLAGRCTTWCCALLGLPMWVVGGTIAPFCLALPQLMLALLAAGMGITGLAVGTALTGSDWQVGKAELTIRLSETEYDCCLPVSALHSDNGGDFVYSVEERNTILGLQNIVRKVYVEVVERNNELAALRNYTTGAPVVAATTKSLQEGARVRTAG